jgi:hypothetical protein
MRHEYWRGIVGKLSLIVRRSIRPHGCTVRVEVSRRISTPGVAQEVPPRDNCDMASTTYFLMEYCIEALSSDL